MSDYLGSAISARNSTEIPVADQNATYTGLVYDGVALTSDSTSTVFAGIRNQVNNQVATQIDDVNKQIANQNQEINNANQRNRQISREFQAGAGGVPGGGPMRGFPGFQSINSTISQLDSSSIKVSYEGMAISYNIPGLVYNKDRTSGEVAGEYKSFDLTQQVPLPSTAILVKISDLNSREQVVSDLNSKGYSYQDFSQYKQFSQLESYLYLGLNVASIVFMAITALFILINMAKFVSEGKKEIGIFRAIGATKGDIRLIFILQSLSYILISIFLGALIGIGSVLLISGLMINSAQSFINTAVGKSVILSQGVSQMDFMGFNYQLIAIYIGILIVVTLIVSLIPSSQAARVSPVEAIRNS
jgi:ABC-type antimicrobial peptide transport system permease subunit